MKDLTGATAKRRRPAADGSTSGSQAFVFSLIHAAAVAERRLEAALDAVGLSLAQYGVLEHLAGAGKPLALSELADRSSCVRSNITQLVDRLEAEGLVERVADGDDRRIIRARLTSAGADRHAAGARAVAAAHADLASAASAADRAAVERLASKLGLEG